MANRLVAAVSVLVVSASILSGQTAKPNRTEAETTIEPQKAQPPSPAKSEAAFPSAETAPLESSVSSKTPHGGFIPGHPVYQVKPNYPSKAKKAHVEGTVVLRAIIGEDGLVKKLTVVSGNELLNEAAISAAKKWRYSPSVFDGEPVEVVVTITIGFKL